MSEAEFSICEIGPNPKIIFCRSQLIFTPDLINKDERLEIRNTHTRPSSNTWKQKKMLKHLIN